MAKEIAESKQVFISAAGQDHKDAVDALGLTDRTALYTIARGSSDAAANILAYEFMRETGRPMTSMPPSVFSVGKGTDMTGSATIIVSQSGASEDLIRATEGIRQRNGTTIAITNVVGSGVESAANRTIPIGAGPELAVPATKSVIGAIAAGLALLSAFNPGYRQRLLQSIEAYAEIGELSSEAGRALCNGLERAQHVYVIGRDTGLGAAQEVALKIKECCAIHAEAYSASEVLHGPLQLATNPLTVIVLDTGADKTSDSVAKAAEKFREAGSDMYWIAPETSGMTPAVAAVALLRLLYPVILRTALALGHDPDRPATLSKVTVTR